MWHKLADSEKQTMFSMKANRKWVLHRSGGPSNGIAAAAADYFIFANCAGD